MIFAYMIFRTMRGKHLNIAQFIHKRSQKGKTIRQFPGRCIYMCIKFGCGPLPVALTTRMTWTIFGLGNPNLNLHLPLKSWEGDTPKISLNIYMEDLSGFHRASESPDLQGGKTRVGRLATLRASRGFEATTCGSWLGLERFVKDH